MTHQASVSSAEGATSTRRRGFFAGLGAVGAVGVLAGLAAKTTAPEVADAAPALAEPPVRGGGYQLSAHVQRYYDTTRV